MRMSVWLGIRNFCRTAVPGGENRKSAYQLWKMGTYSVVPVLSDGTQEERPQCSWCYPQEHLRQRERFLTFQDAFFLFLSFLHGLLHAGIRTPSRRRTGRKGIKPSLPAKPVSKLGDESSLFPVPAFLSHAMLKSGVKFRYGRKQTATGQTEPGKPQREP